MPASSKGAATAPAVLHVIVSLCSGLLRQGCAELPPFSTCLQNVAVLHYGRIFSSCSLDSLTGCERLTVALAVMHWHESLGRFC